MGICYLCPFPDLTAKAVFYLTDEAIKLFIAQALQEDVGSGDHSSLACIPANARRQARLIIKDEGVLAGVEMARYVFTHVEAGMQMNVSIADGETIKYGDIAFTVEGSARAILKAERLVLNCMQRMSGIATYTKDMVQRIEGTGCRLLDTRKTTPNFRLAEKWAVHIGGGVNHRFGLYDAIMLKDNHIDFAGNIAQALAATARYLKEKNLNIPVIIETRNLQEVEEVLQAGGASRILLDNMSPDLLTEAVKLIGNKCDTEASGGITKDSVAEVAHTGVNFISSGALTHSARSLDMSLKAY